MAKKTANRVQLDLSDDAMGQLTHLKEITSATTNAEVFREAMASHAWLVERYQKGERILVKPPEGEPREVEIMNFTVTTVGTHRERTFRALQSEEFTNMRITEEQLQLAFPRSDFHERKAAGLSGFELISKVDLAEWLKDQGLEMVHDYGKLETDFYTKWLEVKKTNYMDISDAAQSLLIEIATNPNDAPALTISQVDELWDRTGLPGDNPTLLVQELDKAGIVKINPRGNEIFLDTTHIDEFRRRFVTKN